MDKFVDGSYDEVRLVYNKFKNAAVQIVTDEQYLPVAPPLSVRQAGLPAGQAGLHTRQAGLPVAPPAQQGTKAAGEYIMEPDRATIVEEIIPKSLKVQLYKAVLDSHAAEHGARMTAMHKATDNADALLKDLKLSYNKARQAAITGEILEIVGGAEALKG
jgi:F-type H+-transporting ATPase subunit gamma